MPPSAFVSSFTQTLQDSVYSETLDKILSQALHVESEADYWASVQNSTLQLCLYYLITPNARLSTLKQDISSKRKALIKIRDERAQILGSLINFRPLVGQSDFHDKLNIPFNDYSHLLRPPWYLQSLPYFLFIPPISFYLYSSYPPSFFSSFFLSTFSSTKYFIQNSLLSPLSEILETIRSGSSASSLVNQETLQADLQSLQQLSTSLLSSLPSTNLSPSDLSSFSSHILTTGDISPILSLHSALLSPSSPSYKNPILSLLLPPNTLLHTLLIQLQKAKVDLDFALHGISHLLKSQQLTFGFVGVAPAFALLYLGWTTATGLWRGTVGWGKWGGKNKRTAVWRRLRRIERILNAEVASTTSTSDTLAPLPTGLMVLSLTKLRSYASSYLPPNIREPFMEDVQDLEDPLLGTQAKLRVVDRMWRCWSDGGMGVMLNP